MITTLHLFLLANLHRHYPHYPTFFPKKPYLPSFKVTLPSLPYIPSYRDIYIFLKTYTTLTTLHFFLLANLRYLHSLHSYLHCPSFFPSNVRYHILLPSNLHYTTFLPPTFTTLHSYLEIYSSYTPTLPPFLPALLSLQATLIHDTTAFTFFLKRKFPRYPGIWEISQIPRHLGNFPDNQAFGKFPKFL